MNRTTAEQAATLARSLSLSLHPSHLIPSIQRSQHEVAFPRRGADEGEQQQAGAKHRLVVCNGGRREQQQCLVELAVQLHLVFERLHQLVRDDALEALVKEEAAAATAAAAEQEARHERTATTRVYA